MPLCAASVVLLSTGSLLIQGTSMAGAGFHTTARRGHLNMVQLLLDHGVDAKTQLDDLRSPLRLASANGHLKIAILIQ